MTPPPCRTPRSPKPFAGRGAANFAKGAYAQAEADYAEAIRLKPALADGWLGRAAARTALGNSTARSPTSTGRSRCGRAIARCWSAGPRCWRPAGISRGRGPTMTRRYGPIRSAEALAGRAWVATQQGDLDRAAADYAAASRAAPADPRARFNLGYLQAARGELDQAVASYGEAIARDPRDAGAFNNRGDTLLTGGHLVEARADFDQALALRPGYDLALAVGGRTRAGPWATTPAPWRT